MERARRYRSIRSRLHLTDRRCRCSACYTRNVLPTGVPTIEKPARVKSAPSSSPVKRTGIFVYVLAIVLGIFSGWVNQAVDDALLTALCVLAFTMFLSVWKASHPWRWGLLVWIGVPLVLGYYQFVVKWPHDRGQVYGAFIQILAASAGSFGGYFMRKMIDHVFLKQDD